MSIRAMLVTIATPLFASMVLARDIPDNLRSFYDQVKPGACQGSDLLQGGFHDVQGGTTDYSYCQQGVAGQAIFLKGNGVFVNMDTDCDGNAADPNHDGRCGSSTDTQGATTFKDTVATYGIPDLDAYVHPYIVFGNSGNYSPTFDPTQHGVHPLSVMAVVCNSKLVYGIWGDTNGDDGPPLVGEAALATGTLCFGESTNGNSGHDAEDVLFIAFMGADAVPGRAGAAWNATSPDDFEASIAALGDKLVQRIGSSDGNSSSNSNSSSSSGDSGGADSNSPPISEAVRQGVSRWLFIVGATLYITLNA